VLPQQVVEAEVKSLEALGVKIKTHNAVGKDITLPALRKEFDAVYIACGTGKSKSMGIPGEDAKGVYLAGEYLYKVNLQKFEKEDGILKTAKHAVIVGGGNVAMDAARCARRMGSEVTVVYRRGYEEMPSRHEEIINTEEEGVKFELMSNPVKIIVGVDAHIDPKAVGGAPQGAPPRVAAVECVKMEYTGETDARGKKTRTKEGSEYQIPCDLIVMALGYDADAHWFDGAKDKYGLVKVNENQMTSIDGVFAGGDIVTGPLTVIKAMGAGREAAKHIEAYLK
jgi:glutamate synthase (NADPH/NADH) small chain